MLTSLHPSGHHTMSKVATLPANAPLLAARLRAAGVSTGAVTTNYNLEPRFGFDRGFQFYRYLSPATYLGAPVGAAKLAAYNIFRLLRERFAPRLRRPENFYRSGADVNAAAAEFLAGVADQPFFLWLHYMEPHDPYFAADGRSFARVQLPNPKASMATEMRAAYADDVRRFDRHFGDLIKLLQGTAAGRRAIVAVSADHGEEFAEHGGFYHGVTLYEEQLRVPLIIGRVPQAPSVAAAHTGQYLAARRITNMARQIDIAPTISAMLGVPPDTAWEGVDLLSPVAAQVSSSVAEEHHQGNILKSIREHGGQRHKLILANTDNPRGLAPIELYSLSDDPGEQKPLANDAESIKPLEEKLDAIRAGASSRGISAPAAATLDDAAKAKLRALGYVQ